MNIKAIHQGELSFEDVKPIAPTKPARILRLTQVRSLTGLGRSSIYLLQAQKRFPQRIKIGPRAVGWIEDEIQRWITDRIAESRPAS